MGNPPPLPTGSTSGPVLAYATAMPYQFQAAWREGNTLVVRKGSSLPAACAKCNSTENLRRYSKTLYWHSPVLFVLILAGVLLFAILAMILRKSIKIDVYLCKAHRAVRNRAIAITWGIELAGVAAIVGGFVLLANSRNGDASVSPFLISGGLLLMIVGGVYGAIRTRILSPKKIDDNFAWLKGAGPEYLNSFSAQ